MIVLRLGIISTARINEQILRGAELCDRVEVVAVGSRTRERAEAYARVHGIARACGSYEELLARADVDAVYISLPNSMHVEWSVPALEAGKHVLCEKPLTRDPAEARQAVEVAARSGRALMEGFMYRQNPGTAALARIVGEGTLGRPRLIRAWLRFPLHDPTDIRLSPSLAGGSLMDLGCYCVDAARLLAGEPESVYGEQVMGPTGVEVAFHGTMRFAGDLIAQFDSSFVAPLAQGLEVVGEEGLVRVPAPFRVDLGRPEIEVVRDGKVELMTFEEEDSYALELESFADMVAGNEPTLPADDPLGQARAIAALYESSEKHLPVVM